MRLSDLKFASRLFHVPRRWLVILLAGLQARIRILALG